MLVVMNGMRCGSGEGNVEKQKLRKHFQPGPASSELATSIGVP
jgi:hypothetical protein